MNIYLKKDVQAFRDELDQLNKDHDNLIKSSNASNEIKKAVTVLRKYGVDTSSLKIPRKIKRSIMDSSYLKLEARELEIAYLLLDSNYCEIVCNRTINFCVDEDSKFENNRDVDILLKEKFPKGIADSERDQGFFYINDNYVVGVITWLESQNICPNVDNNLFGKFATPIFNWKLVDLAV